jgi:hypothetical protein
MNEHSCRKLRFQHFYAALQQATFDEGLYDDKRKVYMCWDCKAWHTSREKVNTDVGLLER